MAYLERLHVTVYAEDLAAAQRRMNSLKVTSVTAHSISQTLQAEERQLLRGMWDADSVPYCKSVLAALPAELPGSQVRPASPRSTSAVTSVVDVFGPDVPRHMPHEELPRV